MVKPLPTFVLFSLLSMWGCNAGISDKDLVFVAPSDVSLLMSTEATKLFGPELRTVLIDCRETARYKKAHIPNATSIPFGHLDLKLYELDNAGVIIIAGDTYNDAVALAMSKTLMEIGFKNAITIF